VRRCPGPPLGATCGGLPPGQHGEALSLALLRGGQHDILRAGQFIMDGETPSAVLCHPTRAATAAWAAERNTPGKAKKNSVNSPVPARTTERLAGRASSAPTPAS